MLAGIVCLPMVAGAQEERPEITPGERKVPRKKDAGPRALGMLQLSANGKASLVPIAILVNGKFWDATAYKADPIPMSLDSGTVYEAERSGSSIGLFTVNSALHSNAANVASPWLGTGKWLPAGAEEATKALKAESVPVGIDTGDGPPRLTKNPNGTASPSAPKDTPPASTAPATAPSPTAKPSDDGPPRLTKSDSAPKDSDKETPPAVTAPASAPSASGTKPTDAKSSDAKAPDPPKGPESDSGASEANRPRLRRGKPVDSLPDDEIPGYSRPGAVASATPAANAAKIVEANAAKGPITLIPAISDEAGPAPRSFAFVWLKDEEGERKQQMLALAKEQLRAYLDARAKAQIKPKPSGTQSARHTPTKKTVEPIFENVQMIAYDLWTNNQPVMVFAADAHMPPPPTGVAFSAVDSELQYTVMLVARTDIYNNLHKLYVGVTDKFHLDLTPRLELIDVVDADGDGRGELLFRETSDAGTGWVVYRVTPDKLWKMFDSLNPE